jgi:7-methyl-GTP pyrophosphatase
MQDQRERVIVLASTSPYRRELLERLGLEFLAVAPDCDEDRLKGRGLAVEELVTRLAREKAESVAEAYPDAVIIGSDQAAELDGEILGKPGTAAKAREQLQLLGGREHRLLTALCVLDARTQQRAEDLDIHRLRLRDLSDGQIARYVAADNPVDCAGSYKIEGLGIALFDQVRGSDFTAVIGLPLTRVVALFHRLGIEVP